jgi:UDP-glucose 4-epimerase
MFESKSLLVAGGTGSFGNALIRRFLNTNIGEIRILSRDEKKQDDMRKKYHNPKLKFYIGDVRDYQSVANAVRNVDFIFHAAALKQVPSCEFYPMEAVKTNILGTENLLEAAINFSVKRVVVLSTDKAVYPINAMGISKAMMEKIAVAKSRSSRSTIINVTRYGNVMCSRGSVIPLFVNQISHALPITITDPQMTRFMMTLDDALDLVLYAFENGKQGEIFVQKSPAATIETLVKALIEILGVPNHPIKTIGTRHGEKLFEVLLSREEMLTAKDIGKYYSVPPDLRDLNYEKYVDQGDLQLSGALEFNSNNTTRLELDRMKDTLLKLDLLASIKGDTEDESEVY